MDDNIDWLFNEPLPSVDMASCDAPRKTEMKAEAGCEEKLHDRSNVEDNLDWLFN